MPVPKQKVTVKLAEQSGADQQSASASASAPAVENSKKPTIIRKIEPDTADLDNQSLPEMTEDTSSDIQPPHPTMAMEMLNAVMGNFFEYAADDETRYNVADILLMIRDSIDKNSKCTLKLAHEVSRLAELAKDTRALHSAPSHSQ